MALCLPRSLRENGTQEKAVRIRDRWSNSSLGLVWDRLLENTTSKWRSSSLYGKWGIESKIETVVTQIHQQISPEGRPQQLNEQQGRILQEGIQAIRDGMTPLLPEQAATEEALVQFSDIQEAASSDEQQLRRDMRELASNQPKVAVVNRDIQLFEMDRARQFPKKYQCPCLQYNQLHYDVKALGETFLDGYYPEFWIQDQNQIYEGGRRRWKPYRKREGDDPSITFIGVANNPRSKPREYMVAAVNENGKEIPASFDVPRSELQKCCSPPCQSFRDHVDGTGRLSPVVDGGWFEPRSPKVLEVPLGYDHFAISTNEVYLVCRGGQG